MLIPLELASKWFVAPRCLWFQLPFSSCLDVILLSGFGWKHFKAVACEPPKLIYCKL
jgi:hypothetical protein